MKITRNKLDVKKIRRSKKNLYLNLVFGTLLVAIAFRYFIIPAGLFSPGLSGIVNGIAYTIWDLLTVYGDAGSFALTEDQFKILTYWIIYLFANIPIIYITLRLYSKRFFGLSVFVFFTNLTFTMFLTFVPGFSTVSFFQDIKITSTSSMVIASIGGILYGFGIGSIFRVGACTMGLDPILRYFSREKNRSIAPFFFAVPITNAIIWIIISYIILGPSDSIYSSNHSGWENFLHETFFSPVFIGSFIFYASYSLTASYIYSLGKRMKIEITTDKGKEISNHLNEIKFHRGHTISEVEGGYSKNKFSNIIMIINSEEIEDIVEMVGKIDDSAFVLATRLNKTYDGYDWRPMTNEDKEVWNQKQQKKSSHTKEKSKNNKKP